MLQDDTLYFQGQAVHFCTAYPTQQQRGCVLLLCGPGETALNWRHIVPEILDAGLFCAISELPGLFGRGRENRNENRAGILWGVLDELDRRAGRVRAWHIVAHGSGCAAALMMALNQPDSVASLVLICPVLTPPLGWLARRLMANGRWGRPLGESWYRRNIGDARNFARLAERAYGMRPAPPLLHALRKPLLRRGAANCPLRLVRDGYALPREAYAPQCPAMVLHGGRDPYARYAGPEIAGAEPHTLRAAAHCPAETDASAVCDFLRGWYRMFF